MQTSVLVVWGMRMRLAQVRILEQGTCHASSTVGQAALTFVIRPPRLPQPHR